MPYEVTQYLWTFLNSTFFQSLAIIFSVLVAYRGLHSWQNQHVWTRNAELAEELLVAARDYMHTMLKIRSPIGYGDEGSTRDKGDHESDDVRRHLNSLFAPLERINNAQKTLEQLQIADSRSRVRFGKDVSVHLDSLLDAYRQFLTTARMRYMMEKDQIYEALTSDEIAQKHEREKIIWATGGQDKLGDQINTAIAGLESALAEYIGKKGKA